jgi:hypothetical protein
VSTRCLLDGEEYEVSCPRCGADEYESCVYMATKGMVGKPTKRAHYQRISKKRELNELDRWWKAGRDVRPVVHATQAVRDSWTGQLEWERREWMRLADWFKENHRIFEEMR